MLTRQGPVNKKTRSLSSPTEEKISYGGPERNGTCPRSHSCAKALSPMVCDYDLSKSLALGSRDLVWTPVHLCSHKGQCLLSGLVRPPRRCRLERTAPSSCAWGQSKHTVLEPALSKGRAESREPLHTG